MKPIQLSQIRRHFFMLAMLNFAVGCSSGIQIIDKPISFSAERVQLTREYLNGHYGISAANINITPRIMVLHWTALGGFEQSFAAFHPEKLPASRPELKSAGEVNVSIQFLVDRDGRIYRLMPENHMARHCIGLNYESIGVENVGGQDGVDDLTEQQIDANARLMRYLVKKYPTINYLIGHHEYREFEGHALWRERDASYRTEKTDPGERFMSAVRAKVSDLKLKGVHEIRAEKSK